MQSVSILKVIVNCCPGLSVTAPPQRISMFQIRSLPLMLLGLILVRLHVEKEIEELLERQEKPGIGMELVTIMLVMGWPEVLSMVMVY